MYRKEIVEHIKLSGIIAIVRLFDSTDLFSVINAIADGGVNVIEVTSNTPNWKNAIEEYRNHPDIIIGVGTIRNEELASEAINCGAQYLVSPNTEKGIARISNASQTPFIMGAYSPTEIHRAHSYGADMIKLFPANFIEPNYLKAVRATLRDAHFVPTGGINLNNCKEWFEVGASAIGLGGSLVNQDDLKTKQFSSITSRAKKIVNKVTHIKSDLIHLNK